MNITVDIMESHTALFRDNICNVLIKTDFEIFDQLRELCNASVEYLEVRIIQPFESLTPQMVSRKNKVTKLMA